MLQSKTLNIRTENGVCYITFPALEQCGVKHAFTTRIGGVSKGIYSSMNMSFSRGDDAADVTENYRHRLQALRFVKADAYHQHPHSYRK